MAGLRAAEAVRRSGFEGEILVIGAEPHMPYNRPPLSKDALQDHSALDQLTFRLSSAAAEVTWNIGKTVSSVDLDNESAELVDGARVEWDGLVIAAGVSARRVEIPGPQLGRYVVRTALDAMLLRQQIFQGAKVVVLGAGFIGCEVAATCQILGADVDVIGTGPVPLNTPLGMEFGGELQRRHERRGVRFHMNTAAAAFEGSDRVREVVLSNGTTLRADLVVEAVGTRPNTEFLEGNGLDLSDGVMCDNAMRVEGRPNVVACGDIARFPNPMFDSIPRRVEHWNMAVETAKMAGKTVGLHLRGLEDAREDFRPVPSFWSDQYSLRIQSFGMPVLGSADVRILEGELSTEFAAGYHRDGELVGVVMLGLISRHAHFRNLITSI
ncbi:NAD(P)/FAD-dependent oxidoreductase [Diaminobutyricibacter sp. McL0608]|uniref:NAD(P)/FAD-dependent oxidoreductase n=1 Tax=Leifsonia sp. McL0608 TaxID=3143537 RepID=UPI0031F3000F